jgi:hypothetical protein
MGNAASFGFIWCEKHGLSDFLNNDVILSLSIRAQATSKKVITKEEWEKKLNDVKIRKEDMNKLVMNFLVTEGYVDAAEKFRMESGTERILSFQ